MAVSVHESSLEYLRCAGCGSDLELERLRESSEIDEGFLRCGCKLEFPIISGLPILWNIIDYFSSRRTLGGRLYGLVESDKMRRFIRSSLSEARNDEDRTLVEDRWSKIYQDSRYDEFYSVIRHNLDAIPCSKLGLEYGCGIGVVTEHMARTCDHVFGIDRSFSAIHMAKKSACKNSDYVVADAISPIFKGLRFDLIVALNVLEIIEPQILLERISEQIYNGHVIISDPYDFDRGTRSIKHRLDEQTLRECLDKLGFRITPETVAPSRHPWSLTLNPRATLNYKVDLIVGKKSASP